MVAPFERERLGLLHVVYGGNQIGEFSAAYYMRSNTSHTKMGVV